MTKTITFLPTARLFRELRKQGYNCIQRAGDCRSCVQARTPVVDIYTTTQSYSEKSNSVWVYFQFIEGTIIEEALKKLNISYDWDGSDRTAFTLKIKES